MPALRVPPRGPAVSAASVAGCESVRLFAARAAASVPGFAVTGENAAASRGSPNGSTGCRWRSNWRRRG